MQNPENEENKKNFFIENQRKSVGQCQGNDQNDLNIATFENRRSKTPIVFNKSYVF